MAHDKGGNGITSMKATCAPAIMPNRVTGLSLRKETRKFRATKSIACLLRLKDILSFVEIVNVCTAISHSTRPAPMPC